jgi:hypothetical protein
VRAIELSNLEKKMFSTPMALRRQGMLRKARRTALSDIGAVQASIHAASMPSQDRLYTRRPWQRDF